ncbi:MAG: zinc ribbon domain-containing protein [Thermoplasmata archaeon]|nr:zinc ribbon domain-containing protein [Thermoplasmata archaeon]
MDSNLIVELLVAAIGVIALAAGLLFILRRRLNARIAALRSKLGDPPEFTDDRSYNLLRIARSEAEVLARQGVDVRPAEDILAAADAALRRRDFDGALSDARRAHELLLGLRDRPSAPSRAPPPSRSMTTSAPPRDPSPKPNTPFVDAAPGPATGAGDDPAVPAPRLAKNRAESHFQIRLLLEEIARGAPEAAPAGAVAEAQRGADEAQRAYDAGEYTDALKVALRSRRRLGAPIESLPAPTTRIPPTPAAVPPSGPAGTEPCATCGRPLKSSDRFCRGCGTSRSPTTCPSCSTPLEPGDKYCAGCGAAVA